MEYIKSILNITALIMLLALISLYPGSPATAQPPVANGMPELLPDGIPVPPGPYLKGSPAQNQIGILIAPFNTYPDGTKPWGALTSILINKIVTEFGSAEASVYVPPREWVEATLNQNNSPAWHVRQVPDNDIQYSAQVLGLDYSLTGSITLKESTVLVSNLDIFSASKNTIIKKISITGDTDNYGKFILEICRETFVNCELDANALANLELNTAAADIKIAPALLKAMELYRGTQPAYSATWRELFIQSRTGLTAAHLLESSRPRNPGSALQLMDLAAFDCTSDILTWRALIKTLNRNKNFERAEKELQAFTERHPDYPPIYDDMINTYTGLGDNTRALAAAIRLSLITGRSYYTKTRLAETALRLAWQLRGHGTYQSVNAVGRKSFPALIKYANDVLEKAININPVSGMVWEQTLLCYSAQRAPSRKLNFAYDKVKEYSPGNIGICGQYLQHYLPLWLNNLEQGWEICRDILDRFPKSDEASLICTNFLNDWAAQKAEQENTDEYKNKNFTDKLDQVHRHILKLEPKNCLRKIEYAEFRFKAGEYEGAMSLYNEVDPECLSGLERKQFSRYHKDIAETAMALKDYKRTLQFAKPVIDSDLSNEEEKMLCRRLMAAAYEAEGRYDLAADLWLKVIERKDTSTEARINYINSSLKTKSADHIGKAEDVARELIGVDPRNPDYHLAMARIHSRRGKRDSALKYLKSAIWLDKDNSTYPEQYIIFSEEAYAVKKYEEAVSLAAEGLTYEQTDDFKFRAKRITAMSYFGLNEFDKAAEAWKRALKINSDSQEAWTGLVKCLNRTDDTREIKRLEKDMEERLEKNPENAVDHVNLALLQYRLKRHKQALESMDRAITIDKSSREYRNLKKRMEDQEDLWPESK